MGKLIYFGKTLSAIILIAGACEGALSPTIAWNPTETDLSGQPLEGEVFYKLLVSDLAGAELQLLSTGPYTQSTVSGLEYNKTYVFRVKAYTDSAEGPYSEKIVWSTPLMPDEDVDGLSDSWEQKYFLTLNVGQRSTDFDQDGCQDRHEFLAGTDPLDPTDYPRVEMFTHAGGALVYFRTKRAEGSGYENRRRTYTLLRCEDLISGTWTAVSSFENVDATDGWLGSFEAVSEGGRVYYRTQIELN